MHWKAQSCLQGEGFGTWSGFKKEDLLALGQHDEAQGAYSLRGDVHGGLPVQSRQHRVLDVAKRPAGQLKEDTKRKKMNPIQN